MKTYYHKHKFIINLLVVFLLGSGLFFVHLQSPFSFLATKPTLFALLVVSIVLLTINTVPLPPKGNSLSMDSAIFLATLFVFGLNLALWALLTSGVVYSLLKREIAWWKHLVNFAMYALMITGAHYIFLWTGGTIGYLQASNLLSYLTTLISYFFINILIIGVFFYSMNHLQLIQEMKSTLQKSVSNYAISLASALLLALLFESDAVLGLIIFTVIILLVSKGFKEYFHLNEEINKDRSYRQQILNSLPVGIITADDKQSNFSLNTAASCLLKLTGQEIRDVIMMKEPSAFNSSFWEIMLSKRICQNVKVTYSRGGEELRLLVSQSVLHDEDQNIIGRIFYFIDITVTEELEKRMHQSEKLAALGELAAGAAHEIRNPLAVLHGFFSLMKQPFTKDELERYQVPLLIKEFDRINAIIEDMLLMARPGAPRLQETTFKTILEQIPTFPDMTENEPEMKVMLDDTKVMVDLKQMKQVIYNLYRNSREAIKGKGIITISSQKLNGKYLLFFKDNGAGINDEMKKSLFHPFHTSKETGTGLGLTIVQRIIENHQGSIEVYETSSKGTTFLITLPLSPQQ
ncbi:two-component system sensor histidine kinase NtrB [Sutcliffiella horikoshii]|uniref:two-component system sensor histidine kinase NtrB n=1 Tax=Sutcliffiella horikoshii TaxID=79883 RepID=UPI003CF73FD7